MIGILKELNAELLVNGPKVSLDRCTSWNLPFLDFYPYVMLFPWYVRKLKNSKFSSGKTHKKAKEKQGNNKPLAYFVDFEVS